MKITEKVAVTKDVFTMLAAISVAAWAVYGTWLNKEERIADLQVLELQQRTSMHSRVHSELSIQKLHEGEEGTVISMLVKLENIGNEDVRVSLDDRSILISKIEFEDDYAIYGIPIHIGSSRYRGRYNEVLDFIDIGPSEKYEISYISRLDEPGVYLVRFLSNMDSISVRESITKNLGDNLTTGYSTGVDKIIIIE